MTTITTDSQPTLTHVRRRDTLTSFISKQTNKGWRVQSRSDYEAQLIKGKPTNHLLHLILSIVTLGFWIPVWIGVALFAGQKEWYVTVDEFGNVK
jgi:hypothetical protein